MPNTTSTLVLANKKFFEKIELFQAYFLFKTSENYFIYLKGKPINLLSFDIDKINFKT